MSPLYSPVSLRLIAKWVYIPLVQTNQVAEKADLGFYKIDPLYVSQTKYRWNFSHISRDGDAKLCKPELHTDYPQPEAWAKRWSMPRRPGQPCSQLWTQLVRGFKYLLFQPGMRCHLCRRNASDAVLLRKVLTTKEERDPFPEPPDSQSNTLLLICTARWIPAPHDKMAGTEPEATSLASHPRLMPSRCDLSREAARRLTSREVCRNGKLREKGGFGRASVSWQYF